MSKGQNKTTLMKQIETYNGFLYQIRQANRLGETRKVPTTTAELIANNIVLANAENVKREKEKIRQEFWNKRPMSGNTAHCTIEEVQKLSAEYTAWNKAYLQLLKELR
jgi:hypothetical protein